ncbi:MAG: phosphatidylserine decarboxylase [Thermoguttaceae bacterium]
MSNESSTPQRLDPKPLSDAWTSIQPGGGRCYRLELAWGRLRRAWLKRFRPGYVRRMTDRRCGDPTGAPHEILDPRDLKYCRNRCTCDWDPADDPFRWRDRLPFARWGLAELMLMGLPLLVLTVLLATTPWWYLAIVSGVPLCLVVYFFRDPPRAIPTAPGLWVAPADGKVVEITRLPHDEFLDGPAVRIGIFLSIFNVHLNRAPCACRVIDLRYNPGGFLNALNPESAIQNENTWIGLEEESSPYRRLIVRQISGAIARRIVCDLRPGQSLDRGQKIGMIKLGSRTELILPDTDDLQIETRIGQKIQAGATILARYTTASRAASPKSPNS